MRRNFSYGKKGANFFFVPPVDTNRIVLYVDTIHLTTFQAELAATSAFAGSVLIIYGILGIRQRRCDPVSARKSFAVALLALVLALLMLPQVLSPVVGYSLLCLALAGSQLFDLLQDERARRRRVASLAPRPNAEAIPTVWVALAVASALLLAPYVILGEQRAAAVIAGVCAFVMAGISWRIASAPVQLHGEDIRQERMRERAARMRKAGVAAVIAMGSIMVFISFVNSQLPTVLPLQRTLLNVSWWTWAVSGVWVIVYSRHLFRITDSADCDHDVLCNSRAL